MKVNAFSMILEQIWISMIFEELWEPCICCLSLSNAMNMAKDSLRLRNQTHSSVGDLTYCCLGMFYGDIDLGQHWRHQAIMRTNVE